MTCLLCGIEINLNISFMKWLYLLYIYIWVGWYREKVRLATGYILQLYVSRIIVLWAGMSEKGKCNSVNGLWDTLGSSKDEL